MKYFPIAAAALLPVLAFAQPVDMLGTTNHVRLGDEGYYLAHSSKDDGRAIRQEYVPPGQLLEHAGSRLLIAYLPGISPSEAAREEIARHEADTELMLMQAPALTEDESGIEIWLELTLIGDGDPGPIIEWHARRHVMVGEDTLIFDLMFRNEDPAEDPSFQQYLAANRPELIRAMRELAIPDEAR